MVHSHYFDFANPIYPVPAIASSNLRNIQNSKVNNVLNIIIILKAITKSSAGQHGPPENAKVGSGDAEE
jgi:hypothetical protein